jgi:hypothetical protein
MTHITLERAALLNLAQQLEARCDPTFIAQELRALVTAATPATPPKVVADMVLEIKSFGRCRGKVHADPKELCDCRHCRVTRSLP